MSALTELLERHVPYASVHRHGLLCLQCVDTKDGSSHGEYNTSHEWALHIEDEIRDAGLQITRADTTPQQAEALF